MIKEILKNIDLKKLKKMDPFKLVSFIPSTELRYKALDQIFNLVVPFNRGIGIKIKKLTPENVITELPVNTRRQNHVGTTHAICLALIGEFTAGMLVAQNYSFEKYRIIIGKLDVEYEKPGTGVLRATAVAPQEWPLMSIEGEVWVELETQIANAKHELVARVKTKWQVKDWTKTKHHKV